jgi:hypothetical protein
METPGDNTRSAVLIGASVAFLIAIGHLYWSVDHIRSDVAALRQSIVTELAKIRVTTAQPEKDRKGLATADIRRLEQLKNEIEQQLSSANTQALTAARAAKVEAVKHADQIGERLGEDQVNKHKEVTHALGEVRTATSARIDDVSTEVASIKNEVATTRYELEKTISDLKRVNGDLGIQSGLIARNGRELAALKALGERNYFDFHLERTKQPQRVGDVSVTLKRTDTKANRYTIEIIVGDRKTEKKDRTINEPVQFYVAKVKMPYEIVVNEVQKDYVIGYLSTPKQQVVALND